MNPVKSVKTCLRKFVVFSGRAQRSEFWWFFLFVLVITLLMNAAPTIVPLLYFIAMLIPLLAVMVRRLHDLNQSGWWALAWVAPILNWLLLIWMAFPGTVGPNRFGPDPKQRVQDDWWLTPAGMERTPSVEGAASVDDTHSETSGRPTCTQCGAELLPEARFCSLCGTAV